MPAVALHRVEQVGHLEGDAFERRAGDVAARGAAGDADDGAARVRVPVRRAQAGERRHEIHAAVVGHRCRQRFDFGGGADEPRPSRSHCTTAPPMKTLPSSAYSVCVANLPGDGGEQPIARTCTARSPVFSSRKQPVP